ncbi:MAG: DUF167 domain-containing protein [Candidatus Micrarchaeota archaeon]
MGRLTLKAVPGAKHPDIEFIPQPRDAVGSAMDRAPVLKVRLTEPPLDGRANRAIEKWLGKLSGTPVRICAGASSRVKTIAFDMDEENFLAAIKKALGGL